MDPLPLHLERAGQWLAGLLLTLLLATAQAQAQTPAQTFTFADLNGKPHSLAEYQGKIVVLNFWATWCLPCREEMPMLSKLSPNYSARGVEFLAVSLDNATTQPKIARFLEKKKIAHPVFTGATAATLTQFELADVVPATILFDRDGTAVFRIVGEASRKDLSSRLDWLLSDRSGKKPRAVQKNL